MSPAVLVTGGAGYIGSQACKALAAAGFLPVAYDNLSQGHAGHVRWGPLVTADITDAVSLDQAIRDYDPVAVMHFAAFSEVGRSISDPYGFYRNNVAGTLCLLEAMRRHGVKRIVFSSTCAIYGNPASIPISEAHPKNPINPYGHSKLMVEQILDSAGSAYGLQSVCLRYFNAAGADPDGEVGERHDPETHLIPLVLDAALCLRAGISIFGDDYPTPDGTCIRDYIHVCDLADAHVLALKWLLANSGSERLNLGNGNGYSVRQVIDAARAVTGRPIASIIQCRRVGDPPILVGDASRAAAVLGWTPHRIELATQIADAWRWHQTIRLDP